MVNYIVRRVIYMIPTVIIISMVSFVIIRIPPGDYLTTKIAQLEAQDELVNRDLIEALREEYGLDKPIYVQYAKWMWGVLHGNFGYSWEWNKPVAEVIGEQILLTVVVSIASLILVYLIAIPIGIYSATHQYSPGDHFLTFLGFLGLSTPNFLLAIVLLYIGYAFFDKSFIGLFSAEFENAPWSFGKVLDLLMHMWIPVIVISASSVA